MGTNMACKGKMRPALFPKRRDREFLQPVGDNQQEGQARGDPPECERKGTFPTHAPGSIRPGTGIDAYLRDKIFCLHLLQCKGKGRCGRGNTS